MYITSNFLPYWTVGHFSWGEGARGWGVHQFVPQTYSCLPNKRVVPNKRVALKFITFY